MLDDVRTLELEKTDPALRHLDYAWASTVHTFQGRTVDNVIVAMEAGYPHLTTQKSFFVEISRARSRAELVTDNAERLKEPLEQATGERISALEGIGGLESARETPSVGAPLETELTPDTDARMDHPPVPAKGIEAERAVEAPTGPQKERNGNGVAGIVGVRLGRA